MGVVEKMLSTNLVGLDIGTYTIKFVQLKQTSKGWKWVKGGVVNIAKPESVGDEELDPELKEVLLTETIKKIFKENKINSRNVVTSLSGEAVIVRNVKLPAMSQEELKGVIQYEAEQYIPNVDQFALNFQILGEVTEDNQKKIEVLLVGAKHDVLDRHLKILKESGLRSIIIDVDCFALCNAFEMNYGKELGEDATVLLNIGSKISTVSIMEGSNMRITRDIFVAGENLTKDIQREFNLSFEQAEELKKLQASILVESDDLSLLRMPNKEDRSIQIFEAISPTLNKLISEIRKFFDYYETLPKKKPIQKLLLSGGSAEIKNLEKYLQEKLGIPVEWNNPFKNIDAPQDVVDTLSKKAALFPVVVGLAVRKV